MNGARNIRKDVSCILTGSGEIGLSDNQYFCETGKAWEIWEVNPLPRMVKRNPSKFVYWIILR